MKYFFEELNQDTLAKLYSEYGLRAKEIGQLVGISEDAVICRLKNYGIPTLPRSFKRAEITPVYTGQRKDLKDALTQEVLQDLSSQGKTDVEIGKMYGMTGEGVAYRRKRHNIGQKTKVDRFRAIPKETLETDYYSMTQEAFSEKYGLSKTAWLPILREKGIEGKSVHRITSYPPFTEEQRALIIGSLLGDGGIDEYLRYTEYHSLKQEQYLMMKKAILSPYSARINTDEKGKWFVTVNHPNFKEFREAFYIDGVSGKSLPLDLIKKDWNPLILAYWFLDDGYYDDQTRSLSIANFCKDEAQQKDFCDFLEDKLGWGFHFANNSFTFSKKYYRDFFDYVLQVATPDMYYKIPEDFLPEIDSEHIQGHLINYPKFYRSGLEATKHRMEQILFDRYWGSPFPYQALTEKRKRYLARMYRNKAVIGEVEEGILKHSTAGMVLCEEFFPNIYECHRKGRVSPIDIWSDENSMRKLVANRLRYADRINNASMRKGIKLMGSAVGNFKPDVARHLYSRYNLNGKVLDYSGGFGARMLAAMSLGQEYVCFEPSKKTCENLKVFGEFLKQEMGGSYHVLPVGSETQVFKDNYFGVAFSSPPYFDYEIYSDDPGQSIARFPEYQAWIDGYWVPTVSNCVKSLIDGGTFAVCLSPQHKSTMIEDTLRICEGLGLSFQEKIKIPFKHVLTGDKYEVIFVFSKGIPGKPYPVVVDYVKPVPPVKVKVVKRRRFTPSYDFVQVVERMKEVSKTHGLSRDVYREDLLLGAPSHAIEHEFGGWNAFLIACGLQLQYEAHSPRAHVQEYLEECIKAGGALSFLNYERRTGRPATRLKRLFNKGKRYAHLKEELFEVVLAPSLMETFLEKFE